MKKTKNTVLPRLDTYKDVLTSVWIEVSPDIVHHTRSVYSVLDWLGDVSGLFDALNLIFRVLLSSLTTLIFKLGLFNRLFEVDVKPLTSTQTPTPTPTPTQQVLVTEMNTVLGETEPNAKEKKARNSSSFVTTVKTKVKKSTLTFVSYLLSKLRLCCR